MGLFGVRGDGVRVSIPLAVRVIVVAARFILRIFNMFQSANHAPSEQDVKSSKANLKRRKSD